MRLQLLTNAAKKKMEKERRNTEEWNEGGSRQSLWMEKCKQPYCLQDNNDKLEIEIEGKATGCLFTQREESCQSGENIKQCLIQN